MTLILYYTAFMIGGDLAAYLLGLLVEYEWGKQVSLLVFLALYFDSAIGVVKIALPSLTDRRVGSLTLEYGQWCRPKRKAPAC